VPAQAEDEQPNPPGNKNPENEPAEDDLNQRATDGFLVNGSVLNGAASRFAQAFAFGNFRPGAHGLYNGGLGLIFDRRGDRRRRLRRFSPRNSGHELNCIRQCRQIFPGIRLRRLYYR
jgi:hypothetical protein